MKEWLAGSKEALDNNYPIYILWEITQRCNFKCSYCQQTNRKPGELSIDNLIKIVKKLEKYNIIIDLFGGEPTLNSNYLKLLDYLKTSKIKCITTSNGYKNRQFFEDIINQFGSKFEFTLSYHHEQTNINEFVQKVNILNDGGSKVNITYICHPNYFNEIKENHKKILDSGFSTLNMKLLWDYDKTNIYSDEYLDWINNNLYDNGDRYFINNTEYSIHELKRLKLNNFNGWKCQANKVLFIDYMGNLYRQCFKFSSKPIFNILLEKNIDSFFSKQNDGIDCIFDDCGCDMYLKVLKWKNQ